MDNMTSKELSAILKACVENGVSKISINNVTVEFSVGAAIKYEKKWTKKVVKAEQGPPKVLSEDQKDEIIDDELARLLLEDPLEREKLLERAMLNGNTLA